MTTPATDPPTPLDHLTQVLLAEWTARKDAGVVSSAEDHCRALAEAVARSGAVIVAVPGDR